MTLFPPLLAVPVQIPLSSFFRLETFVKPCDSILDFAWPSVKLFAPGTGAAGLVVFGDLTAGV